MEADEAVSQDFIADAMNELANMIGGGVKRRMVEFDSTLKLGFRSITVHIDTSYTKIRRNSN